MHRNWVEISLSQIVANYRELARVAAVPVCPVVKADAYRHGAPRVALALEAEGARFFAVSNTEEALALRRAGIAARLLIMGDFLPFEIPALFEHNLTPIIHSLDRLRSLDALAPAAFPVHLKLDTGMGRLGCRAPLPEIIEAIQSLRNLRVEGLTTHFSSANDYESGRTESQLASFEASLSNLRAAAIEPEIVHLSSSGPVVFGRRDAFATMIRPGIALYGYGRDGSPNAPPVEADVRPALAWYARILEIRDMPEGSTVGYNARWRAPRPSRIAVIAAGYADGIPQQLSCKGSAILHGHPVPYVGAVSMDLITLDITTIPEARIGDPVTLLGPGYDADAMARDAGVISYSILCGIANRPHRIYL